MFAAALFVVLAPFPAVAATPKQSSTAEKSCIVVEPGMGLDGVRLGENRPEAVTPGNFAPGDKGWWETVGQTRIRVNAAGVVDLVEHPLSPSETCVTLDAGGQTARLDLTLQACLEMPFEGCSLGSFNERVPEWWDCTDSGVVLMKDPAHGIRVVPAEHAPVWTPPPDLTPDGCLGGLTYEQVATLDRTGVKLPRGTLGMHDAWSGHTGFYLCTPGGSPETIQTAIEAAFRRAGYAEVTTATLESAATGVCNPDHVWSGHGHTYWFKLTGGPRWEITSCPRCEWQEQQAAKAAGTPAP